MRKFWYLIITTSIVGLSYTDFTVIWPNKMFMRACDNNFHKKCYHSLPIIP